MLTPYPDETLHNPEPGYFRRLLRACGFTYADASLLLQCDERTVGRYASGKTKFDYAVQFLLECQVAKRIKKEKDKMSCPIPENPATVSQNAVLRPTGQNERISAGLPPANKRTGTL